MRSRLGGVLLLVGLLGAMVATFAAVLTYVVDGDGLTDEERAVSECESLISQTLSSSRGPSLQNPVVSLSGARGTVEGPLEELPHDRWRCVVVHDTDGGGWDAATARNLDR